MTPAMTPAMTSTMTPAATLAPRILVVEDELIVVLDIGQQLRELGCVLVGHASSGEQALALAGELRPDLVPMDVHLAGEMDGISAAQAIRTQYHLPCVFISAFSSPESRARAERCQPAGYLAKPFDEHQLRGALTTALDRHPASGRLRQAT